MSMAKQFFPFLSGLMVSALLFYCGAVNAMRLTSYLLSTHSKWMDWLALVTILVPVSASLLRRTKPGKARRITGRGPFPRSR